MRSPRTIDLFCGCGGMSQGFKDAGFSIMAAIDNDQSCIDTYIQNHYNVEIVLRRNLQNYQPSELKRELGENGCDVVMGGPPCRGFSLASMNPKTRANYGKNQTYHRFNALYRRFFDYIREFKPTIFVMENVLGLGYKSNGLYLKKTKKLAEEYGYAFKSWNLNAAAYGVPQIRRRLFIVGSRNTNEINEPEPTFSNGNQNKLPAYRGVGEAILDLPPLEEGSGEDIAEYDFERINEFNQNPLFRKDYSHWARNGQSVLRHHVARPHSERDLRIFDMLNPGETSRNLSPEQKVVIPYNMKSFTDKYRKQHLTLPSTTITSHLAKDGLYFAHPTQRRSFTPREAARLQSFRDSYLFSKTRTNTYRQIGNAVPPLLANAVANAVKSLL